MVCDVTTSGDIVHVDPHLPKLGPGREQVLRVRPTTHPDGNDRGMLE
jgi:hypothetical protein